MDKSISELKRLLKYYKYTEIVYCKDGTLADGKDVFGLTNQAKGDLGVTPEVALPRAVREVHEYFQVNVIDMINNHYERKTDGFIKLTVKQAKIEEDARILKKKKYDEEHMYDSRY
jgi:hypothetical protein